MDWSGYNFQPGLESYAKSYADAALAQHLENIRQEDNSHKYAQQDIENARADLTQTRYGTTDVDANGRPALFGNLTEDQLRKAAGLPPKTSRLGQTLDTIQDNIGPIKDLRRSLIKGGLLSQPQGAVNGTTVSSPDEAKQIQDQQRQSGQDVTPIEQFTDQDGRPVGMSPSQDGRYPASNTLVDQGTYAQPSPQDPRVIDAASILAAHQAQAQQEQAQRVQQLQQLQQQGYGNREPQSVSRDPAAQKQPQYTPEQEQQILLRTLKQMGGHVGPNGELLAPTHVIDNFMKYQEAPSLRGNELAGIMGLLGQGRGGGGANPRDQYALQYQASVNRQLENEQKELAQLQREKFKPSQAFSASKAAAEKEVWMKDQADKIAAQKAVVEELNQKAANFVSGASPKAKQILSAPQTYVKPQDLQAGKPDQFPQGYPSAYLQSLKKSGVQHSPEMYQKWYKATGGK